MPHPGWDVDWLHLVSVLRSSHSCYEIMIITAIPSAEDSISQHATHPVFWLLYSFHLLFHSVSPGSGGVNITLSTDQLRIFPLTATCCHKQLLWPRSRAVHVSRVSHII